MYAWYRHVTREEAIEKIENSINSVAPILRIPELEDEAKYIKRLTDLLFDSVIDPVKVQVKSTCVKGGDFALYENADVWGIARIDNNWLLTLENEIQFALGFGSEPSHIKMHGFSSADVLGEFYV